MLVFPTNLMRESSITVHLMHNTIASAGGSLTNVNPVVVIDGGGLWSINMQSVRLRTPEQIRLWRALVTSLEGGATPVVVPICETRFGPFPTGTSFVIEDVPFDDDALFNDDTGFSQPIIVAETEGHSPLRETVITVELLTGIGLSGGEFFSIDHPTMGWRLYQVIKVEGTNPLNPILTIRPPLREAVDDGSVVEFDMPRCVMQLAAPTGGALTLDLRRTGSPSIDFIEAFPAV